VFGKMLGVVLIKAHDFDTPQINNTLCAMVGFEHYDRHVVDRLLQRVRINVCEFSPRDISNTLNAMVVFNHYDRATVDQLLARVLLHVNESKDNTEHTGTRTTNARHGNATERLDQNDVMLAKAFEFDAHEVATILNAMATFDHYDMATVERLMFEALRISSDFAPKKVATTLNAMARFNHHNEEVMCKMSKRMIATELECDASDVVTTLHSMALLCHFDKVVVSRLMRVLERKMQDQPDMSPTLCFQLYQYQLYLRVYQSECDIRLPDHCQKPVERAFRDVLTSSKSSPMHLQVSDTLNDMRVQHTNEGEAGGLLVDIVITAHAHATTEDITPATLVIEVNELLQFCHTDPRRELGQTQFKRRMLMEQGMQFIQVPYFEWCELTTVYQRQAYMRNKLTPFISIA
jgi:hypothetical protein